MNDRLMPPPAAPPWLKVPFGEPTHVTVLSELRWWFNHWLNDGSQGRRCGMDDCVLCAMGNQRSTRFVLGVEWKKTRYLLELRDRHRSVLTFLQTQELGTVGAVLQLSRRGNGANAPVEVEFKRKQPVPIIWETGPLVDALGLPALTSSKAGISLEVGA